MSSTTEDVQRPGAVVWITGLPSSGKSTFAERLRARLLPRSPCCVLDGDRIRAILVPAPSYDAEGRNAFYATLAGLAGILADDGLVAIVAATAHERRYRERARALAPRFIEVFVDVDLDECKRRDDKGLYARASTGAAPTVPGSGVAYERPEAPDVVARGGHDDEALRKVLELLERAGPPSGRPPGG